MLERVRAVIDRGGRRILGITGAPGAGKSTLAHAVVDALGDEACLVGMDGFHLAQAELVRLDRRERKGAPDTFDALGYVALLRRLRAADERTVYAPVFDRSLEEPIACAVPVPREVPLVVTEGNYLLVADGDWAEVGPLLDESWYVEPPEDVRIARLIARHEAYGRSPEEARERSLGSDQRNAEVIAATRRRADVVVELG
nr:nucleoside/nucleotide kinase family protein [Georgenia satyanarayanai]